MRKLFPLILCLWVSTAIAQKKPLTHAVYDSWQSIGERYISNDGKFVAYTITPQEGDAVLVVQATDKSYRKEIARGLSRLLADTTPYNCATRQGCAP